MHKAGDTAFMGAPPGNAGEGMQQAEESESMVKAYKQQDDQDYGADMEPLAENEFVVASHEDEGDQDFDEDGF